MRVWAQSCGQVVEHVLEGKSEAKFGEGLQGDRGALHNIQTYPNNVEIFPPFVENAPLLGHLYLRVLDS